MRYLLTISFVFALLFQSYAQQPAEGDATARVGELINSTDYITLSQELPRETPFGVGRCAGSTSRGAI